ncbi:MAG: ROK family protein [Sulfuriferula multivorans]|uniref:ROK family protein n=1 Tax=Sulfuriferula multivorans TaxID=1559896 RepID=A0A7C9P985_9PROT|nr:ROK family protein [Sulfuriferula multivorans]
MELIAGDIGGTKSWLAWVTSTAEGKEQLRFEKVYASADFVSADALLKQFIKEAQTGVEPDALWLALPGALNEQRTNLTNLEWTLDAAELQQATGISTVRFINDFQAAAAGVATLTTHDTIVLNPHAAESGGVRAITGAGTGLGLAFMMTDATGRYQSYATEGGHIDFAPGNAQQMRLLEHLGATYGHVSWERAVSGSAMNDLYRFSCIEQGQALPDVAVEGAALVALAEAGNKMAEATLDLFIDLYGAWVGNVALLYQPRGGLFIAGGVAGHLQARMQSPRFMAAATGKGRMRSVVERTPIFLITCNRMGVQGVIASARTNQT